MNFSTSILENSSFAVLLFPFCDNKSNHPCANPILQMDKIPSRSGFGATAYWRTLPGSSVILDCFKSSMESNVTSNFFPIYKLVGESAVGCYNTPRASSAILSASFQTIVSPTIHSFSSQAGRFKLAATNFPIVSEWVRGTGASPSVGIPALQFSTSRTSASACLVGLRPGLNGH